MKNCKINGKICNLNNFKQLHSCLAFNRQRVAAWYDIGDSRAVTVVFYSYCDTVKYQKPYQCVVKGPLKPPTLVVIEPYH